MTLLAHQHRMVQEREELADRLGKLGAFITGPRFASLDHEDRRLLIEQNDAMTD